MTPETLTLLLVCTLILLGIGLYGLLIIRNLIKIVIALQIMIKAAMLALVVASAFHGQLGVGQSLALAVITADTIVAMIGLALAIKIHERFDTLNIDEIVPLEG